MTEAKVAFTKALIKARAEFKPLAKDTQGRFKYASLTAIKNSINQALEDNGFSYHTETLPSDGKMFMWLFVSHESGHERSSAYPLNTEFNDRKDPDQQFGSSLSYAMRNLLRTFFCLDADENDPDNEPATLTEQSGYKPFNPSEVLESRGQQRVDAQREPGKNYGNPNKPVSEKQVALIHRLIGLTGADKDEVLDKYGVESLTGLNGHQASELISELKKKDH